MLRKPLLLLADWAMRFIVIDPLVCTSLVMAISLSSLSESAISSSVVGFMVAALVVEALDFLCLTARGGVICSSSEEENSARFPLQSSFSFLSWKKWPLYPS